LLFSIDMLQKTTTSQAHRHLFSLFYMKVTCGNVRINMNFHRFSHFIIKISLNHLIELIMTN
jgi:hypothetical protein